MSGPSRTPLRPWRYLRAGIGAFLIVRFGGDPFDPSNVPRFILGAAALLIAFGLLLRMERFIQDKREAAERGPNDS